MITINLFLIYAYKLITWYIKLRKQQLSMKMSIRKDILWPTLHLILYHGGLHEIGEVECLETTLTKNEIAYHGSMGMLICP